jgi:hypothetical protein
VTHPILRLDAPARYRIRVQGELGDYDPDGLEGLALAQDARPGPAPVITLSGRVKDQGALIAVLNGLLDRGLLLLSVECPGAEPVEWARKELL